MWRLECTSVVTRLSSRFIEFTLDVVFCGIGLRVVWLGGGGDDSGGCGVFGLGVPVEGVERVLFSCSSGVLVVVVD